MKDEIAAPPAQAAVVEIPAAERPNDPASPSAASPIADLTYRNYDGPFKSRYARWWIVALAGIRLAARKWWIWALAVVSTWPYLVFGFLLYLQSRMPGSGPQQMFQAEKGQKYAMQFFQAFDQQLFWLMLISLAVGAASIASDNRTNALMIYLSKPLTKGDYLLGKWVGIFVPVFAVAFVPALLLYVYCLLGYTSDGFLREEPWLILRIIGACAVPAAVYASLMVGVSAWAKSPLIAGAVQAGIYFATGTLAGILWLILYFGELRSGNVHAGTLVQNASLSGVIKGLAWNIYHVTVKSPVMQRRHGGAMEVVSIAPPQLWVVLPAVLAVVVIGVLAARMRIRAVEVVKG